MSYSAIGTAKPDDSLQEYGNTNPKVENQASAVSFDPSGTDMSATNVQSAIVELNSKTTSTNFTSQLSFDTGYSLVDGTIRKQGTLVVFSAEIDISQVTVSKVHRFMTLPSNLRPAEYIEGSAVAIDHSGGNVTPLRIIATSGGAVVVYAANNIPADYYIEFDITYFTL